MTKQKKISFAIVAALATGWAAAAHQSGRSAPTGQAPDASAAPANVPDSSRTAARQPSSVHAPAPALTVPSTKELLIESRKLDAEQLSEGVKAVDTEIAAGQYVERANAGTLHGEDVERFRGMLRRRNALEIAKTEQLIAAFDAQR